MSDEALYERAIGILVLTESGSTSQLQRKLGVKYDLARQLMERAETDGVVTRPDRNGARRVVALRRMAVEKT